ncbi:hypothetical protein MO867_17205 [Microbulbifer sp. OS29]|uniref:Phage minor structural protein GP20 n=1 Tax=Microbulbifer okhotskensis TaxID=2926617 RepID=A0A9X2EQN1_9GAMM|nr:hypothetical protein [Microbulbifer okhotskensis]MCO1336071.1 hypothetical protein [Microbulbifer okhotskensis]
MLKKRISDLSEVEEQYRGLYEKSGDGYALKIEGDEEDRYRAKHEEAERHRKAAEKKVSDLEASIGELQNSLDDLKNGKHRESGDIEALEKSWQEKYDRLNAEKDGVIEERDNWLKEQMVTSVASGVASEIAVQGSAKALMLNLESRLSMEVRDGKPTTVVLDANGKPSAMTVEELKAEFSNDPAFAPLIVGSKASGGGAAGGGGGGASKKFSEMSEKERVELYRNNPETYRQLRDAG